MAGPGRSCADSAAVKPSLSLHGQFWALGFPFFTLPSLLEVAMGQSLGLCGVWALPSAGLVMFVSSKPSLVFLFYFIFFPPCYFFFPSSSVSPFLPLPPSLSSLFSNIDPNILCCIKEIDTRLLKVFPGGIEELWRQKREVYF